MGEILGMVAALASSALGGSSITATRYLARLLDPLAIGAFRFAGGFFLLLPVVWLQRSAWPARADRAATMAFGLLFFFLFPILFNAALARTTAARGALALSTLPLLTMLLATLMGRETLSLRRSLGVLLATGGVALALLAHLDVAPVDAWRGDLLMVAAALCMALYNIGSGPLIRRSSPLGFTLLAMAPGALGLLLAACWFRSFQPVESFAPSHWLAALYLGAIGSALTFWLWALALARTSATLVAVSVTVNPLTASLSAVLLLGEPLRWSLLAGIVAVLAGILLALPPTGRRGQDG